jgi:hypothetical protein
VTDDERAREVSRLINEALRLSDTYGLAVVHYLLGIVLIEANRELSTPPDPPLPPGVVQLRQFPAVWGRVASPVEQTSTIVKATTPASGIAEVGDHQGDGVLILPS